ncbi:hypothetical protein B1H58_20415 (plasmid) [Pantoea alhagi]|uniref:HTH araC/xylS-type domain-containing protein n=1 Tax=Pantoea alhagi TaxID=1891675 RepID=A0A1W6BBE7_9GAMM|nr:helix-turn-helix transcriptional regulator [Pantoea alhagi]ARJ44387.1 hypothetical protein B1H58_20415 [Pantoea alhagi]
MNNTSINKAWFLKVPLDVLEEISCKVKAMPYQPVKCCVANNESKRIIPSLMLLINLISILATDSSEIDCSIIHHSLINLSLAIKHKDSKKTPTSKKNASKKIKSLIIANPTRDWCSSDFEEDLHVSGATLRRRLAQEGTSLRQLIRDTRMELALKLIKTSDKSIKVIALECGYSSASCFSRNFTSHFGLDPSSVNSCSLQYKDFS